MDGAVPLVGPALQTQRVTVTNRVADLLYTNHRTEKGELAALPAGAQAVEDERARPFPAAEAEQWLARYRDVLTNYAAAHQVNPTTTQALQRVVGDADTVVAMARSDPAGEARRAHAAAQPLMLALATTDGGPDRRPVILLDDQRLEALGTREAAAEAERRQHLDPVQHRAEDAIRRQLDAADKQTAQTDGANVGGTAPTGPDPVPATPSWRKAAARGSGDGAWRNGQQEQPESDRRAERRRLDGEHDRYREQDQGRER